MLRSAAFAVLTGRSPIEVKDCSLFINLWRPWQTWRHPFPLPSMFTRVPVVSPLQSVGDGWTELLFAMMDGPSQQKSTWQQ